MNSDISRFWSDNIDKLSPYTPGEQPQIANLIKLNTNENPYGPSPKVLAAISAANNEALRKYPDPNASELKRTIAEHYGLERRQVFVGNSSDEVLAHIFRGLLKQQRPILYPDITYSFYPVYCDLFEINCQLIPLNEKFEINFADYPIDNGGIIFANPNAPTGIAVDLDKIESLLQRNTNSVVVIDEAYVDFGAASAAVLIDKYPNLVVTQTLSKSRSLAGLRVGFAMAHENLIEALERVKNSFHPYALDALALAGAKAAFEDDAYFQETRKKVITTRERTTVKLAELGFNVLPSKGNFVFVKHSQIAAEALFQGLREKGIVTRYFEKPRINDYLRISIGTDDEMLSLLTALGEIIGEGRSDWAPGPSD
ncbi:MAG: histidinol-phosphate aminotransferase [Arenicella sp.]|jgi:histidinol-phosphate aminotransferase